MRALFITLLLVSCGETHKFVEDAGSLIENIGQAPRNIGNALLGTDKDSDENIEKNSKNITDIGEDVTDISEDVNSNSDAIGKNANDIAAINDQIDALLGNIDDLYDLIEDNTTEDGVNQNLLQQAITFNLNKIAALESNTNITSIIDPCGDSPGFDEVLIKTDKGNLIGYFQQGSKRFLVDLTPGNYRTTDAQKCNFTVNEDRTITE